jgi:hypothetical protein
MHNCQLLPLKKTLYHQIYDMFLNIIITQTGQTVIEPVPYRVPNKPQSSKPWNLTLGDLQPRNHILDRVKWTPTSASKIEPKFFVVLLNYRDTRSSSPVIGM